MTYFDMRKANISIFKILRNQKIALSRLRLTEAMAANILKENSRCDGILKQYILLNLPSSTSYAGEKKVLTLLSFYHLYLSSFNTICSIYICGTVIRCPTI